MHVRQVPFHSDLYYQLCDLRNKELRLPLGLVLSEQDVFGEENQFHFGVFSDEKAIACTIMVPKNEDVLKMRQVCTAHEYQGKGIGSQLLVFIEDWARDKGYSKIECHARQTAVNFYKRHNYQIEGEIFEEVGIPHYFMTKTL